VKLKKSNLYNRIKASGFKNMISHISKLARIGLSKKEKQNLEKEFSDILNFVKKLEKVDTSKVKPTSHIIGIENITREDKVYQINKKRNKLLKLAPKRKGRYFKVKAVL